MTLNLFLIMFGSCSVGAVLGMLTVAVIVSGRDADTHSDEPLPRDTLLVNYLEQSECNLFFNPEIGAWGLLDGGNKMLATAHTVRNTLVRAMEKDDADGVVA